MSEMKKYIGDIYALAGDEVNVVLQEVKTDSLYREFRPLSGRLAASNLIVGEFEISNLKEFVA